MAKLSHSAVDYGPGHKNGDHCAICRHYQASHCALVVDPIQPLGWCKRFQMADTTTQSNNKAVTYRGRAEREMPMLSKAQNAAMHAAAEGKSTIGIPKKVGKKFVAESHGEAVKKLPGHVRKGMKRAHKRGLISDKQMAKLGE